MKKYANKKKRRLFFLFFFIRKKNKETLGLLSHKRNKYIKQRGHHSIFELLQKKKKGGNWIIDRSGYNRPHIFSFVDER